MLKTLSYLNIGFALTYFALYLLNSSSYAMAGILVVVVFNALVLRALETGRPFKIIHSVIGGANVFFAGFMTLWVSHIIISSIEYHYFGNTWLYILITVLFIISILIHFVLMLRRGRRISK